MSIKNASTNPGAFGFSHDIIDPIDDSSDFTNTNGTITTSVGDGPFDENNVSQEVTSDGINPSSNQPGLSNPPQNIPGLYQNGLFSRLIRVSDLTKFDKTDTFLFRQAGGGYQFGDDMGSGVNAAKNVQGFNRFGKLQEGEWLLTQWFGRSMSSSGPAPDFDLNDSLLDNMTVRSTGDDPGGTGLVANWSQLSANNRHSKAVVCWAGDDSNDTDFTQVLPILSAKGWTAITYTITSSIDELGRLTLSQLHALEDAGWAIGTHGINEIGFDNFGEMTLGEQITELSGSKTFLQTNGFRDWAHVSFPEGEFNNNTAIALDQLGFLSSRTVDLKHYTLTPGFPMYYTTGFGTSQSVVEDGGHTGSNGSTVYVDAGAGGGSGFGVDALVGGTIYNRTDDSSGLITSNTATTITAVLSGGVNNLWNSGDESTIYNFKVVTDKVGEVIAARGILELYFHGSFSWPRKSSGHTRTVDISNIADHVAAKESQDLLEVVNKVDIWKESQGIEWRTNKMTKPVFQFGTEALNPLWPYAGDEIMALPLMEGSGTPVDLAQGATVTLQEDPATTGGWRWIDRASSVGNALSLQLIDNLSNAVFSVGGLSPGIPFAAGGTGFIMIIKHQIAVPSSNAVRDWETNGNLSTARRNTAVEEITSINNFTTPAETLALASFSVGTNVEIWTWDIDGTAINHYHNGVSVALGTAAVDALRTTLRVGASNSGAGGNDDAEFQAVVAVENNFLSAPQAAALAADPWEFVTGDDPGNPELTTLFVDQVLTVGDTYGPVDVTTNFTGANRFTANSFPDGVDSSDPTSVTGVVLRAGKSYPGVDSFNNDFGSVGNNHYTITVNPLEITVSETAIQQVANGTPFDLKRTDGHNIMGSGFAHNFVGVRLFSDAEGTTEVLITGTADVKVETLEAPEDSISAEGTTGQRWSFAGNPVGANITFTGGNTAHFFKVYARQNKT